MWIDARDRYVSCLTGKRKTRNGTALRVMNRRVLQRWFKSETTLAGLVRRPDILTSHAEVSSKSNSPSIGFAVIRTGYLRIPVQAC